MAKKSKKPCEELPILHPDAASIDVSASELFVAVSADRDRQPVRSFPTFTRDLNALADWLQSSAGFAPGQWSQRVSLDSCISDPRVQGGKVDRRKNLLQVQPCHRAESWICGQAFQLPQHLF